MTEILLPSRATESCTVRSFVTRTRLELDYFARFHPLERLSFRFPFNRRTVTPTELTDPLIPFPLTRPVRSSFESKGSRPTRIQASTNRFLRDNFSRSNNGPPTRTCERNFSEGTTSFLGLWERTKRFEAVGREEKSESNGMGVAVCRGQGSDERKGRDRELR